MYSNSDKAWKPGRVLIGIAYLAILIFPLLFWFDENHYQSPLWHIHAKFHLLWKSMLMILLGGGGLWMIIFRWRSSTARSITRWIPVLICATYCLSHFLMSLLAEDNAFPHLQKIFWDVSIVDLIVGAASFIMTIAAFEDMKDEEPRLFPQSG